MVNLHNQVIIQIIRTLLYSNYFQVQSFARVSRLFLKLLPYLAAHL